MEDQTQVTQHQSSQQTQDDQPNTEVSLLLNLESLIKSHISGLQQRKEELKQLKEMMQSAFQNDSLYQEAELAVKEANKKKRDAKARLMKLAEVRSVQDKANDIAAEIKEMDAALSDYLREYQRLSGSNEIVDDQGNVHEITYIAKLIKKGR